MIYQSPIRANVVFEVLVDAASPATTAFRAAVAYVTREGARRLVDELAARVGTLWTEIPKALVTCFDFGVTEPGALEYLQQAGFEVRIANLGADGAIRLSPAASSFHPKVYLTYDADVVRAVIGSANLSRRAMSVNTEVVTATSLEPALAEAVWAEMAANSVALTPKLLQTYIEMRPRQRAATARDEPPIPTTTSSSALPEFRAEVESGKIDPSSHQAFWVEVGGPSGGVGSQLELPRRGNTFFGFDFDDYDNVSVVAIGQRTLATSTGSWTCKLAWHGDNRMERINLPTTNRSGLRYSNKIVLFQRSGEGFELTVAEPDSARARRWTEESASAGTLYRFGSRSPRRCGLL